MIMGIEHVSLGRLLDNNVDVALTDSNGEFRIIGFTCEEIGTLVVMARALLDKPQTLGENPKYADMFRDLDALADALESKG